jgi:hypothetical protein
MTASRFASGTSHTRYDAESPDFVRFFSPNRPISASPLHPGITRIVRNRQIKISNRPIYPTTTSQLKKPETGTKSALCRHQVGAQVGAQSGSSRTQVEAQVTAPVTPQETPQVTPQVGPPVTDPVTPPVGGQPESRPEWFSKGAGAFSPRQSLMAGWKTRPPVIDLSAVLCSVDLAKVNILEKIGV